MKLNKQDRNGARDKLAKAGLTERQLDALEDMILRDAINWAESDATSHKGKRTHRIGGIGSLLSFAGDRHAREAVRVATYWYHEKSGHLQPLSEERQYDVVEQRSTWRPE